MTSKKKVVAFEARPFEVSAVSMVAAWATLPLSFFEGSPAGTSKDSADAPQSEDPPLLNKW